MAGEHKPAQSRVMSQAESNVPPHIRAVRAIDRFTDVTGTWVAWLNIPLVLAVSYEVVARYAFNAPTIWSYDVTSRALAAYV